MAREQFFETALRNINEFIEQVMLEVPELRGVIVIPVWRLESESLPTAVIRGPDGQPDRLSDIFALSQATIRVQAVLHQYQLAGLKQFDQMAAKLAEQIHAAKPTTQNDTPAASGSVTSTAADSPTDS